MPPGMESYFRSFLCIFQHPGLSLRSGTVSVLRCGPGGTRTPMQPIILSTHYECEGIQAQNRISKTHPPFLVGKETPSVVFCVVQVGFEPTIERVRYLAA
jgi:hypothetical protein